DDEAQLLVAARESPLQGAENGGGDSARMPVHPHHAPEGLEPERVREAAQDAVRPFLEEEGFDDDGPEARHAGGEPSGNAATMEREIRRSAATHTGVQYGRPGRLPQYASAHAAHPGGRGHSALRG